MEYALVNIKGSQYKIIKNSYIYIYSFIK